MKSIVILLTALFAFSGCGNRQTHFSKIPEPVLTPASDALNSATRGETGSTTPATGEPDSTSELFIYCKTGQLKVLQSATEAKDFRVMHTRLYRVGQSNRFIVTVEYYVPNSEKPRESYKFYAIGRDLPGGNQGTGMEFNLENPYPSAISDPSHFRLRVFSYPTNRQDLASWLAEVEINLRWIPNDSLYAARCKGRAQIGGWVIPP